MAYSKTSKLKDDVDFIYKSSAEEIIQTAKSITVPALSPASLHTNSLAKNLVQEKKTDAFRYLQFAKKTEALSPKSQWEEAPKRDSLLVNKYLAEAIDLFSKATEPFFKNKYAFQ